ncbi:MAG: asparagine synthase (glutamine-hydrolyzing) [Bacteroidales bacterium]|nr:asparagine synthase (glutamine-hydrolyzing) [Bacteroidales bacterium]
MCGIYGAISKDYAEIKDKIKNQLNHRGPDDSGFHFDKENNVLLGHNRLSIIDLSINAHQPMTDESSRFTIVYNGEVYNYKELQNELQEKGFQFKSNSDTEVVLKSFMHWKEKCLDKFRGMFAFAIYDNSKKQLFLARDRFGIKPLIYSKYHNQFIFSSELKVFLSNNIIPKKINLKAVEEYFKFGCIQQPQTILNEVYHVMPGHYMIIDNSLKIEQTSYYNITDHIQPLKFKQYNDALHYIRNEFEEATKYHIISDVDVGAFLSGGVDSTAVVSLMQKLSSKNIHTFSLGFKQENEVTDESGIAERTAKKLGTIHKNIHIDDSYVNEILDEFIESLDQPSFDGINTFIISKESCKQVKVALSGLGGDEIFAGYPHFHYIYNYSSRKQNLFSNIGQWLNHIKSNRFTYKYTFFEKSPEELIHRQRIINNKQEKVLNITSDNPNNQFEARTNFSALQRISIAELNGYLLNTLLRDNDIVSMANSQEVRPILLDHKLVESALSIPDSLKLRNGRLKSLFIDSVVDIIPEEVWKRKKTGFNMPYGSWLNGVLNNRFLEEVNNCSITGIITPEYLNSLKQRINNRVLTSKDWLMFVFVCWVNKYDLDFTNQL